MKILKKIKSYLSSNINNSKGWSTKRKIIVLESDDWGAIRMPSKFVYEFMKNEGVKVNKCSFCKYDSLASEDDLKLLFNVLQAHKTKNNQYPILTANTIMANPDFERIKDSNYTKYYYEIFTKTLKRYPDHKDSFKLWKYGIKNNLFYPQLHGREHLNVALWMSFLQNESKETKLAFDLNMFGISTDISTENRKSFMAALNYQDEEELEEQKHILKEAQSMFKETFGFASKSFIAPNYVWSPKIESTLADLGVEFLQSSRSQLFADGDLNVQKSVKHFTGERNNNGQFYLVRNCIFEPSTSSNVDHVKKCLEQIAISFRWNKPAIIATHRLNYIGFIDPENRTKNLEMLNQLLGQIIKKWPDVEFMTSDQLGELIKK